MPNRLALETSPYLLQHSENPVDWYPWGEEALGRARERDQPLLVSIGYSACHWCHVMERESFEDEAVARLMNDAFVCIKVDREERPDVDAICMEACQGMTGQGGWPLNVFLTPEERPFFAGTYFPPSPRHGMPSWPMVLQAVAGAWQDRREDILEQGRRVAESLGASARVRAGSEGVSETAVAAAVAALGQSFDRDHGGWGGAPKFPPHCTLEFLLSAGEREMALATLRAMAAGGIYDQLGGGFARYAVDATWTVPHFEKMLYDNALLARAYLHGWQVCGEERLRVVCCETLDWALREMRGPEGGFCSALDADSEGVEGKFYAWSLAELREVLGGDGAGGVDVALAYFGTVTVAGNFEAGLNVLEARGPRPADWEAIRDALLRRRSGRTRPGLDDKRLCGWNALMIAALADAGAALGRDDYVEAARGCADFVLSSLRDADGQLLRTWKDGRGRLPAVLEDHAFLLEALVILYEATFEPRWYEEAVALADTIIARFADEEHGGFFTTPVEHPHLIVRRKDLEDAPIPSGSSSAALGLLRLARLAGEVEYERRAIGAIRLVAPIAARHPGAFGHLLRAVDFLLSPVREVAIVGESADGEMTRALRARFRPHEVIAGGTSEAVPLLEGRVPGGPGSAPVTVGPAAYVCDRFACQAPVGELHALLALLPD